MKKNFIYALLGAIALSGAASLTACSSSDEIVDNPNYDPETNTVKTAISLSIDPNGSAKTRMTESVAQSNSSFRGIQDMWLIPSNSAIATTTSTTSKIELGTINAKSDFDANTESQKTYTDKEVTVGTTNFLFLGKAKPGTVTDASGKLANGYTTNNIGSGNAFTASTVGDILINSVGIAPATASGGTTALSTEWTNEASALATYLTDVANVESWKSNTTNANLLELRNTFTSTTLRAGSSEAVLLTLQSLYNKVSGLDATISAAIRSAIVKSGYLKVTSASGATLATLGWEDNLANNIKSNFPEDFGLPQGAAQYRWNSTNNAFEYVSDPTLNAANTAVHEIVYPNELYYLTNTALKATSNKVVSWPASVSNWTSETWTGWTDEVKADSKNIALNYNIQYGTALLSSTVQAAAEKLYDNAKALDPEQKGAASPVNKAITLSTNTFPLTGVLVGGQPSAVTWNFLPAATEEFKKVIYDNNVSSIYVTTTKSSKNYTLVFDNLVTSASPEQKDVSICLEFKNDSGQDFYGIDGIILAGQKFYIVGRLSITNKSFPYPEVGGTATTSSDIAEKTASYYPSTDMRVFIQDFETIADFTLTAGDENTPGSLGKAFATIPDLRTTNQTLGLSVDLSWRPGLTYSVNLGE